jgi:hypothetical protein
MQRKTTLILALSAIGLSVIAVAVYFAIRHPHQGVLERYDEEVRVEPPTPSAMSEQLKLDARMLSDVLVEVDKIEAEMLRMNEEYLVSENENEGVYTVEQEDDIAEAYRRYLVLRKALFHIAFRHKDYGEIADPEQQDQAFLLAYASALTLYRNGVVFVLLFKDQPNARRKLNEANPRLGVPEGMFEEMYANITSEENVQLILSGVEEFEEREQRLQTSPVLQTQGLEGLLERLGDYEAELAEAYTRLAEGRVDVLWTTLKSDVQRPAYKTQSIISMLVSHVRVPLHAPGLTPETVREEIRPRLKPGDILLTRRDGYLSNTFLPGHWGHAAMYLGSPDEIRALGEDPALEEALAEYEGGEDRDGLPFAAIEAIGEGVRFSSAEFALHANSLAVLRPRVTAEETRTAIRRAMELRGVPYDFSFDLSSQDKIICTELVYRAYAPHLDVPLEDVMGRKTLKPDGMVQELAPADDPRAEFVLYGTADDGELEEGTLPELLATVE